MKSIAQIKPNLLEGLNKKTNWRAPFIEEIIREINLERKGTKYRPVTFVRMNDLLSHLKTRTDLHYLCSIAKDAKNRGKSYGKVVFGSIKTKE
jgi:hypothetical protein